MKHSRVVIADLKTIEQCDKAVDLIENDYQNIQGGISAWTSGYTTHLLAGAKTKLEAIQRKNDKLWLAMSKANYKEYLKTNDFITFEDYEENHIC